MLSFLEYLILQVPLWIPSNKRDSTALTVLLGWLEFDFESC